MTTRGTFNTRRGRGRIKPIADVIGWQEMSTAASRRRLVDTLTGYDHFIPPVEAAAANPISWLRTRFTLVSSGYRRAHGGKALVTPPRYVTWVVLTDRTDGKPYAFVNTHMISRPALSSWRTARWAEHLQVVADVVTELIGQGLPVSFAGDLNKHTPVRVKGLENPTTTARAPYDQFGATPDWLITTVTRGPRFGSDHHSFVATHQGDTVPTYPTFPADPYTRVIYNGAKMDAMTQAAVMVAESRLGYDLTITQGCYAAGRVSASGGTHDGGGVVDLAPYDWANKVRVLRDMGWAAWHREAIAGLWPEHIHAVLMANAKVSPTAATQIVDYKAGLDGLAKKRPDPDPYRPDPLPVFKYPPRELMPPPTSVERARKWIDRAKGETTNKVRLAKLDAALAALPEK